MLLRRALAASMMLLAAAAPAAGRSSVERSRLLWATVNVCDTEAHPNTIGIRGSMPGTRRPGRMYMRFRVQYFDPTTERWHWVDGPDADTGWIYVGSSRNRARQAGVDISFVAPPQGQSDVLRGVVNFRWRRGHETLHRARKNTKRGHRSSAGADPPDYSAGLCEIVAP